MRFRAVVVAILSGLAAGPLDAQQDTNDSASVVAVVDAFHAALVAGDSRAALQLLADDVLVLEGGDLETRAEYRAHHLQEDMRFAQALPSRRRVIRAVVRGDAAWVVSTNENTGTFQDRPIDSVGAELVVLSREPAGWRIRAIHWSSRSRRPPR